MQFIIATLSVLLAQISFAQSTYVKVGEAKTKKAVVALTDATPASATWTAQANQLAKTIQSDLEFVDLFKILPQAGFPQGKILKLDDIQYPEWIKAGADYVAFSTFNMEGDRAIYEFHLVNAGGNKEVFAKRYSGEKDELKVLAHTVANDIVQNITGKKGIFLTKIAMVCEYKKKKEIFTMNFDGSDQRAITNLRSIAMNPAWSPDGTKIAFSVYNRHSDNNKNIDLYEYNFKNGALKPLSNRKGINSGAAYNPTGGTLVYTMSYTGNPELHQLDLETKQTTQMTKSLGFDVDPAFSPDGKQLAFVSSRGGKPMVYVMNATPNADAKRLTFAGNYNATPGWSPDGKKIVFAGWLDKHFDLFTITPDGSKIERLTKDEGNNEDPTYSPDGNFLVFSSNRRGGKNIFFMNAEGGTAKPLTSGQNCVAPKWSPYL